MVQKDAGPFEIMEVLGEGSFGTVAVARVTSDPLRRLVALKILKGAYTRNAKILNRTRDEARLLSRISHPNIVRVERLMEIQSRPVVVMEYVQGPSLDAVLRRYRDGLPVAIALEITKQMLVALHVAYTEAIGDDGRPLRVIHRDIKPSNVLLSVHGEVKVVDFGIAKGEFDGREAKTESVVLGSRPYMAPERLDGVPDDHLVDVYSSGMSLYELLTGRTMSLSINPRTHSDALEGYLRELRVTGMSEAGLDDLRALLRRMCAYDRQERPDAQECVRLIEGCLYAIDPRHRYSLDEFGRTVVQPIYDARPKLPPEDAVESEDDSDFIREVTGQIDTEPDPKSTATALRWTPYVFVGVLTVAVLVLGGFAVAKFLGGGPADAPPVAVVGQGVQVKFWFPSDATATVNGNSFSGPSTLRMPAGPTLVTVDFDDGRTYNCSFKAREGAAVRYVVEGGKSALSVDDQPGRQCTEASAGGGG